MAEKTLKSRLIEINDEARAWMAAGPGRWQGLLSEDPMWWSEAYGITTAEDLDAYLDAQVEAATSAADRRYYGMA